MKKVLEQRVPSSLLDFISCGYEEGTEGQSYGPATREYDMIHFVLAGQGHYYIGGQHFRIDAGQCFLTPAGTNTFYHADALSPWTYCWICFNGQDAASVIHHCGFTEAQPILNIPNIEDVHRLINTMMECFAPNPSNKLIIQGLLAQILGIVLRSGNNTFAPTESADNNVVKAAILYIQEHSDIPLSVEQVAEKLFISRTYLFSLFKKYLLVSPQTFIINARISKAREMLAKSDISIQDIAYACGYHNPFAFSRAFHRETSLSPRDYRKLYHAPDKPLDR